MPIKYIPYLPQTVEGQAILNNFQRTRRVLEYRDNDKVLRRIQRGMPLYEVETTEHVGDADVTTENLIIRGECVSACAYLKEHGVEVDLVYIDPPFASGADYAKQVYLRRNPKVAEAIAKAEEQLELDELRSFEEKMYGDIWNKEDYLNWMYENLMAIKAVMSPTASIYLHIDWHVGHYVKVLMDEVFGEENFINEIIWKRQTAKGDATQGARHMGRIHETIFLYAKDFDLYTWNLVYTKYDDTYAQEFYRHKDPDGRRYQLSDITAPGGANNGNPYYTFLGVTRYYRFSEKKMQELYDSGKIVQTAPGTVPRQKRYLDEMPGVPLQSLWTDIQAVQAQSDERVDYSTQKPEALLERIINASSNVGMVVADFFGGSGVTAAVANRLGRTFIHADVNINSIQTTRDRLAKEGASFNVLEVKDGVSLFRNPVQTMDKLRGLIPGLRKEEGIDKFWAGALQDSKAGMVPVYLPNLLDHSTKVLDLPLVNQIVYQAMPNLPEGVKRVVVYYVDIDDEKAVWDYIDEAPTDIIVELRDLKAVLDDVVLNDEVDYALTEAEGQWTLTIEGFRSDRLMQKINDYNAKRGIVSPTDSQLTLDDSDADVDIDESADEVVPTKSKKKKAAKFKPIVISDEGLELIEYLSLDCQQTDGPWHSDIDLKIDKKGYVLLDGKKTGQFWDGTIQSSTKPLRMKVRNVAGDESVLKIN